MKFEDVSSSPLSPYQNSHVSSSYLPLNISPMPSHPFPSYQNSHLSSSSLPFNNSHMNNHMTRRNFECLSSVESFQIRHNPHLTQVSFTQTITRRYTTIVPTNTLNTLPYGNESVTCAMDSRPNIWDPISHHSNVLNNQPQILNPTPLNTIYPGQDSADYLQQYSDMFSLSSDRNHVHRTSPSMGEIPEPTNGFETGNNDNESDGDDDDDESDDGMTHSIPCEKYGPFTCPKCNNVFDTSQKFAAHMSIHYRSETNKEREQRRRAKSKRKHRKFMKSLQRSNRG